MATETWCGVATVQTAVETMVENSDQANLHSDCNPDDLGIALVDQDQLNPMDAIGTLEKKQVAQESSKDAEKKEDTEFVSYEEHLRRHLISYLLRTQNSREKSRAKIESLMRKNLYDELWKVNSVPKTTKKHPDLSVINPQQILESALQSLKLSNSDVFDIMSTVSVKKNDSNNPFTNGSSNYSIDDALKHFHYIRKLMKTNRKISHNDLDFARHYNITSPMKRPTSIRLSGIKPNVLALKKDQIGSDNRELEYFNSDNSDDNTQNNVHKCFFEKSQTINISKRRKIDPQVLLKLNEKLNLINPKTLDSIYNEALDNDGNEDSEDEDKMDLDVDDNDKENDTLNNKVEEIEEVFDSDIKPTPLVSHNTFIYPKGIPYISSSPNWPTKSRQDILWKICCNQISPVQNVISTNSNLILQAKRRLALLCQREYKTWQMAPNGPKLTTKAKRCVKDMITFWRRNEKEERELRKIAEKEAAEERKREEEKREARRQARKLNFLITQTELYSHFIGKKLGSEDSAEAEDLNITDNKVDLNTIDFDEEDDSTLHEKAKANAGEALRKQREATRKFDKDVSQQRGMQLSENTVDEMDFMNPQMEGAQQVEQPKMLTVTLKEYQLKGLNWLANLYEQGINGILADEMGLGKTIQSISLMAHLAESQNIWGPFLVVTPSSTLHNWIQEINRFTPHLKVVPYWGNMKDREILRRDWKPTKLYRKTGVFHVMVTSYNIVVKDEPFFHRVKWQYMILDEAQAIKSSSSSRWKKLLGFNCRNRLLLTGTPIQNSMQELWALLHFIMPTLFDSHEEFSDWFSKDIESHAENKGSLNERQLKRLHMILKPFMLRRIKRDVENELSEKKEVELKCQLSIRQKQIFERIKQSNLTSGEDIDETINNALEMVEDLDSDSHLSKLANLVMQFRKICNHPELFERADVTSPLVCFDVNRIIPPPINNSNEIGNLNYYIKPMIELTIPSLIYKEGIHTIPGIKQEFSQNSCITKYFNIYSKVHIWDSLKNDLIKDYPVNNKKNNKFIDLNKNISVKKDNSSYGFLPLIGLSINEFETISTGSEMTRFMLEQLDASKNKIKQKYFDRNDLGHIGDYKFNNSTSPANRFILISTKQSILSNMELSQIQNSNIYYDNDLNVSTRLPHISKVTTFLRDLSIHLRIEPFYSHVTAAPPMIYSNVAHVYQRWESAILPKELIALMTGDVRLLYKDNQKYELSKSLLICKEWIESNYRNGFGSDYGNIKDGFISKVITQNVNCKSIGMYPAKLRILDHGDSPISVPSIRNLFLDSGKMQVLEQLLPKLKSEGHRVLIFFQMTKMIDIFEEYLNYRKYTYLRLDGSTSIGDRRDMVSDWQTRPELFIFLLSTRAGGVGINLTAADTVIFYDSDWNPTVDQQAMDRCHRLGQTKEVTVYRLITENTIEERIILRAKQKGEIQRVVIAGRKQDA